MTTAESRLPCPLRGIIPPMVTPLDDRDTLDRPGLQRLVEHILAGGVNGLFLDWSVRKVGLKEPWTLKWYPEYDTAGPWTKAGGVKREDWPEWLRKFKDY